MLSIYLNKDPMFYLDHVNLIAKKRTKQNPVIRRAEEI